MKITIYFGDKGVQYDNAAEAIEMLQKIERQEIANKLKLADETLNKADEIYNILVNENKKAEKSRQAVTENRKESGQRESQKVVRHYVPTNEWYPNPWFGIYPPDHSGGYVHTGKTNFT